MKLKTGNLEKINKIKSWFFEKINKVDKPVARLTKKKQRIQIPNIRNERGDITTEPIDTKRIIKEYYEQLYDHKFDNLDEMDQFLQRHSRSELTQEDRQSELAYVY